MQSYVSRSIRNLNLLKNRQCACISSDSKEEKMLTVKEKKELENLKNKTPLGVPWFEHQYAWKSALSNFAPQKNITSPDFMRWIQTPIDYRPSTLRKWYARKKQNTEIHNQRYLEERHSLLGSDLATAHFVVHRGGSVKFCGELAWVTDIRTLPINYVAGLYIEAINAKGMCLYYEGLINFLNLTHLKWLSFEGCPHVDDWCLDKISCEYPQLEYLDVSHCPNVTHRGLSCLYRMVGLKTLVAAGSVSETLEFKYSLLLLEDILSGLKVIGVNYDIDKKLLELE